MREAREPHSGKFLLNGVQLDALRLPEFVDIIDAAIAKKEKRLMLGHNLHSLYLYLTDPDFSRFYQRPNISYIDGMPLVWLSRIAGIPMNKDFRITFLESIEVVMREAADRGWRVFYFGGTESSLRVGLKRLIETFPHLNITGRNGYLRDPETESAALLKLLEQVKPDMLFVGLGMPLQERWLDRYYDRLAVPVVLTCGTTLSYVTAQSYRPPLWASTLGLYGVMRLTHEPRRLWRRYLLEPLYLAFTFGPGVMMQRFSVHIQRTEKHRGREKVHDSGV